MERNRIIGITAVAIAKAVELLLDSDEEDDIWEKNENFFEVTITNFSDEQFRQHFRLRPITFEILFVSLGAIYNRLQHQEPQPGTPAISLEKKLLMCLWYLANVESHRSISDRFGVSKWTCWTSCNLIFNLVEELNRQSRIISFPTGERATQIIRDFEAINGFPGILGVIDGCHIRIEKPKNHGNSYINRKDYASILLQGICDRKKRFLDIYTGEPGSIHDYRLFMKSDIYGKIVRNHVQFPDDSHLIGDLAYKLSTNLMVGFKDNGQLTDSKKLFNKTLNKNRVLIENAFGLLKCRWRRLKILETKRMDLLPQLIYTCCVIHNFAIDNNDFVVAEEDNEEFPDEVFNDERNDREAQIKRDNLKNVFFMRHLQQL